MCALVLEEVALLIVKDVDHCELCFKETVLE